VILHQKTSAEVLGSIAGGSFVTSHWFMVADTVVHFVASVVAIITGIPAAVYYMRELYKWTRNKVNK
jgi:hypothetical protein